jgi:hypothetical protein
MTRDRRWLMRFSPLLTVLVQCSGPAPAASSAVAADSTALAGHFTSAICEPFDDTTFQIRHYAFGLDGATATWVRYSDPRCVDSSQLMTIVMSADASFTGLSLDVLGASNITVNVAQKTITPTAAGLPIVQQVCGQYPWQAGVPQSIESGCSALFGAGPAWSQLTDDCPAEYDLVKLTLQGLVFGDRSHPLCSEETRPTRLSQYSVVLDPLGYVAPSDGSGGDDTETGGGASQRTNPEL